MKGFYLATLQKFLLSLKVQVVFYHNCLLFMSFHFMEINQQISLLEVSREIVNHHRKQIATKTQGDDIIITVPKSWGRRSFPGAMSQTTRLCVEPLFPEGYLCPCPLAMSTQSLSLVICNPDRLGKQGSKIAWSPCSHSFILEKERPVRVPQRFTYPHEAFLNKFLWPMGWSFGFDLNGEVVWGLSSSSLL